VWIAAIIVGVFAIAHGHAHGTELPLGASGVLYSIGFVIATGLLHALGIGVGLVHRWPGGRIALRAPVSPWVASFFFGKRSRESPCEDAPTSFDLVLVDSGSHADCSAGGARPSHEHGIRALLAGLRGPRFGRAVLFALPAAWLVGSAGGLLLTPQFTLPVPETIVTIAIGALLAADRPLPFAFVAGLAILLGLLHGILNGSEIPTNASGQLSADGVAAALFVLVSLLAGQAASMHVPWARVAVRVAGSWIVAMRSNAEPRASSKNLARC
jgi:hydrogenase/urease accessory protein HupE